MEAALGDQTLCVAGHVIVLEHRSADLLYIQKQECEPLMDAVLAHAEAIPCGLDHIPDRRRIQALAALTGPDAQRWLGLGCGLTPSFDDACVGAIAVCRAAGIPVPFRLTDFSATTDVSAHYLKLAYEGYFGEPVCTMIKALYGQGDLSTAISALLSVGATSGADMLRGMLCMVRQLKAG